MAWADRDWLGGDHFNAGATLGMALRRSFVGEFNEALYDIFFRTSKLTLPTLWQAEAAKRGLPNFKISVQAVDHLTDAKNVELLKR